MALKRILLLGLLALPLVVSASADAGSRFHLIGKGSAWGDGDRWAVLQLEGKPLRVIDDLITPSQKVYAAPLPRR
jgi:hypothetical protein